MAIIQPQLSMEDSDFLIEESDLVPVMGFKQGWFSGGCWGIAAAAGGRARGKSPPSHPTPAPLTVRSSRYIVLDRKSIPMVAWKEEKH